jgi:hypothetical protein
MNIVEPAVNVARDVTKIFAMVALPELVPFVGPMFGIIKGIVQLAVAVRNQNRPNEIKVILKEVQHLADKLNSSVQNICQRIGTTPYYNKVHDHIRLYETRTAANSNEVIAGIKHHSEGLNFNLMRLQEQLIEFAPNPGSVSWISNLCKVSQEASLDISTDATWGLKAALQVFTDMFALQKKAVDILRGVGDANLADERSGSIQQQVRLFWDKFELHWKAGGVKLLREFPREKSLCYGDLGYDSGELCFYRFVGTARRRQSALQVINLDHETISRVCSVSHPIYNSHKTCRVCVDDGKLYTVNYSTDELCSIDLNDYDRAYRMSTICSHKRFHWRSQMVCHDRFLYAIDKRGKLCKIDLRDNNHHDHQTCSSGWSTSIYSSTALAVMGDKVHAIAKGRHNDCFYNVETRCELNPPGRHSFTSMAMTGHGQHLYVVDSKKIYSYNSAHEYRKIVRGREYRQHLGRKRAVHLMSAGLSLYLQANSRKSVRLYLVKPHWCSAQRDQLHSLPRQVSGGGDGGDGGVGEVEEEDSGEEDVHDLIPILPAIEDL